MEEIIIAVVVAMLASSGFWMFVMKSLERKDATTTMLMGLGHDRIIYLGLGFLKQGYVTAQEYENLYEFLYVPYRAMGGNGSACRIMEEVKKLPLSMPGPIIEGGDFCEN